jgi:formylglycine-generating enzyme required for sulfatase activity
MGSTDDEIATAIAALHPVKQEGWKGHRMFQTEQPQRRIALGEYRIGLHPVTNAQYAKFVEHTRYKTQGTWRKISGKNPNTPATFLSWFDAEAFCDWSSFRLPTEVEWEKAARGPNGLIWPWGNQWDPRKCRNQDSVPIKYIIEYQAPEHVLVSGDGHVHTIPAGTYRAAADVGPISEVGTYPEGVSTYGCHDMSGNVLEWCVDWFYEGVARVLRGGGYRSDAITSRCATRLKNKPKYYRDSIGFRIALDSA